MTFGITQRIFRFIILGSYLSPIKTPFCRMSRGVAHNPGYFILEETPLKVGSNSKLYAGKIAILVNETTQSSAEFHTMAFQTALKSKVFGSQTAGADGNVSRFSLPGGVFTAITGLGVYYPDGRETQRIGMIPDVEVKPTLGGIKSGKDEVLEKAVEWIRSKKTKKRLKTIYKIP
ncbi:MAG: S41 family peptidase [Saprospiraceae bacterium]|nr:S41 family peptidase [Saprospiraceae bacterium]